MLANEDLLLLIIHHCIGADALRTYSTAVTNPTRAVCGRCAPLLRRLIDDAVTSYSDSMRRGYGGGFVTAAMFMERATTPTATAAPTRRRGRRSSSASCAR